MTQLQVGDVIRWRGLPSHLGVVVGFWNAREAAVCYADNPEEAKDALVSDLRLTEGSFSEDDISFIDGSGGVLR